MYTNIVNILFQDYNIVKEDGMEKTLKEFQKEQAISCFNQTWDYIDNKSRTEEDDLNMIHCAHTSRYLWGQVGEPLNFERGEWQIAKVYALLNKGQQALYHATACLKICEEHHIEDFDIVFAYEAMATAYKILGNNEQVEIHKKRAYNALPQIEDDGNRNYALSELDKI